MRIAGSLAAASAAALLLAPAAPASMWPAPSGSAAPTPGIHLLKLPHARPSAATRACMHHGARAKAARWLAPVACEQPPRSQILLPLLGG